MLQRSQKDRMFYCNKLESTFFQFTEFDLKDWTISQLNVFFPFKLSPTSKKAPERTEYKVSGFTLLFLKAILHLSSSSNLVTGVDEF